MSAGVSGMAKFYVMVGSIGALAFVLAFIWTIVVANAATAATSC
jgi:hypothetical protein